MAFVTWMIFSMARAARSLSGEYGPRSTRPPRPAGGRWSSSLLAVGREGLETALFWAATQAAAQGTGTAAGPLLGAALGLLVAVVLGYLIYRGALKINLSRFFTWTGAFLIVIAAGVLTYGVHDLQEARFLPGLNNLAFDVSGAIPPTFVVRNAIEGRVQLLARNHVLEAAAWLYFVPTMTIFSTKSDSTLPHVRLPSQLGRPEGNDHDRPQPSGLANSPCPYAPSFSPRPVPSLDCRRGMHGQCLDRQSGRHGQREPPVR